MLEENKTNERLNRHKDKNGGQEDFTPEEIVSLLCQGSEELFTDFSKTVCDPCAGICYILRYILKQRLKNCHNVSDIKSALSTIYGTELYKDNVIEGRQNMVNTIIDNVDIAISSAEFQEIDDILLNNIVCTDTFKWDYENWCPIKEDIQIELF